MGNAELSARAESRPLPDREERETILHELERNMLVEAAAGTGKTTSMVGRMLALLRTGTCEDIRTMAAVTFTRKSAAELRARFQVALEKGLRECEGAERERLGRALDRVEQCFIGTIHSFCGRLLRERPVEAGVDIAFEEIEEEADQRMRAEAWEDFTSGLIAEDPRGLVGELNRLGLNLSDLRAAFMIFCDFPDVDEWPLPEAGADPGFERARSELEHYIAHMVELAPRLAFDCGTDSLVPKLRRLPRIVSHYEELDRPDQLMEVLELFEARAEIRVTFWQKRGGFTKEEARGELQRWDRFSEEVVGPALSAWRELRYAAVIPVLQAARGRYDVKRHERGWLNFQDLLMKAAGLLRENPTVRRYFQARFTHLLVDEFQDTDPIQAEVIMLLCSMDPGEPDWRSCAPRPGSLFLVGDPKQSIYRFRRADIVTYNEAKRIILADGGMVLNLSTNFRSPPSIISWVNDVFAPGEPAGDDDGKALLRFPRDGTEESPPYVPLLPGRGEVDAGDLRGLYRLCIPEEHAGKESALEFESDIIARVIRNALDRGLCISRSESKLREGLSPRARPDDFMIVTRNKKNLSAYARALQHYGIPHQVTGGSTLNELEELRLLHVCLRAVTHPDDPVSLVAALRSECFGMSDRVLYAFRKAGGSFSFNAPLPEGLAGEDAEALHDAFSRLKNYSLWLSRLPHAAVCERIAGDLGLPALAAARPGGDVQAGSLFKALELLRGARDEEWSASQLVEHLGRLVEHEERYDGVSALSGEHPVVRVMNLHKVKGLEAPVIFLADPSGESDYGVKKHIDRSGSKNLGYLAIYSGGSRFGDGRLLAHPPDWELLAGREKGFERAEALRLRYVAATRAGAATVITQKAVRNRQNPWLHFDPFLKGDCDLPDPGPQSAPAVERVVLSPAELREAAASASSHLTGSRQPTYGARPLKEYALSLDRYSGRIDVLRVETAEATPLDAPEAQEAGLSAAARPFPSVPDGEHGVEWGEVVHLLLQSAAYNPRCDLERLAAASLAEAGLTPSLAPQAASLARSVTASDIWRRAMESECRMVEVPLQVLWSEGLTVPTVLRGTVDLAFKENGGWVLVDYKTDRAGHKDLERTARKYASQVLLYAQAWEKCSGQPVKETYLYFTGPAMLVKIEGG